MTDVQAAAGRRISVKETPSSSSVPLTTSQQSLASLFAFMQQATTYEKAGKHILALRSLERGVEEIFEVLKENTAAPHNAVVGSCSEQMAHATITDEQKELHLQVSKAAERLVLKYNAMAIAAFKEDEDFSSASDLLQAAVLKTEPQVDRGIAADRPHQRVDYNQYFSPLHKVDGVPVMVQLRATTFNNFGCLERRRRNFTKALQLFDISMETDPKHAVPTLLNKSALLGHMGKTDEAINVAKGAIHLVEEGAPGCGGPVDDGLDDLLLGGGEGMLKRGQQQQPQKSSPKGFPGLLGVAYHNLAMALEMKSALQVQCTTAYVHAVSISERELGPTHPTTFAMKENQKKYSKFLEAEVMQRKAQQEKFLHEQQILMASSGGGPAPSRYNRNAAKLGSSMSRHQQQQLGISVGKLGVSGISSLGGSTHNAALIGGSSTILTPQPPVKDGEMLLSRSSVTAHSLIQTAPETPQTLLVDTETPLQKNSFPRDVNLAQSTKGATYPVPPTTTKPKQVARTTFRNAVATSSSGGKDEMTVVVEDRLLGVVRQPKEINEDMLEGELRKRDDVVQYMATRLTHLLRMEDAFEERYQASVRIQCLVRASIAKTKVQRLQEARQVDQHRQDEYENCCANIIKQFLGGLVLRKRERVEKHLQGERQKTRRMQAIIKMQAVARMWHARRHAGRVRRYRRNFEASVRRIQCWTRQQLARKLAVRMRIVRSQATRQKLLFEQQSRAAALLQATYHRHRSAIHLLVLRGDLKAARERDWQRSRTHAVVCIQRMWKGYLVRKVYGRQVFLKIKRMKLSRRTQSRRWSATRIQSAFRGYYTRRVTHKHVAEHIAQTRLLTYTQQQEFAALIIQCFIRKVHAKVRVEELKYIRSAKFNASKTVQRPVYVPSDDDYFF